MKKNQKTSKKFKKWQKTLVVLCLIVMFICELCIANQIVVMSNTKYASKYDKVDIYNQLVPEKDENGDWVFTTNRDFKVMQLTDIHQGGGYLSIGKDRKALDAVATMITREKPDLVIVTGDIAFPVPYQAGTFNNKNGIRQFGYLMEKLGVYWTVTLGNHDSEIYSCHNREYVSELFSTRFGKCLFQPGPEDVDGYGNHVIKVKNTSGIITQAFIMMDSHSYTDGDYFGIDWKYDNIHQNQVDWYKAQIEKMNKENKNVIESSYIFNKQEHLNNYTPVKSLAFFHIPLVETRDAWLELEANGFKDTDSVKYIDGIIGETGKRIFCGVGEDNLFETMVDLNSTKAIFNGHDHYNNATFSKDGIIFSYGYSIDYLAYSGIANEGSQRGCTIITVKGDGNFTIDKYNYYSDRYPVKGGEIDEIEMQFYGVEYQVPDKE